MALESTNITPVIQGAVHPDAAKEIGSIKIMTERLKKLKKEWEEAAPQVYVDDTLLFTESWKETEQMPVDFRWAKTFQKRMENCEILIRDPEIIVGSSTKFIRGNNTLCAVKPGEILAMCRTGKFDRKLSDISSTVIDTEAESSPAFQIPPPTLSLASPAPVLSFGFVSTKVSPSFANNWVSLFPLSFANLIFS